MKIKLELSSLEASVLAGRLRAVMSSDNEKAAECLAIKGGQSNLTTELARKARKLADDISQAGVLEFFVTSEGGLHSEHGQLIYDSLKEAAKESWSKFGDTHYGSSEEENKAAVECSVLNKLYEVFNVLLTDSEGKPLS
jgi:hypothetical protein